MSVFKDRIGQVTNFGLRILAHRALTKNGDKRILYGGALTKINACLLDMGGLTGFTTTVQWPDPLPADPQAVITTQVQEYDLGVVSKETLAEERGRSWAMESKRREKEAQGGMNLGKFMVEQFDRGGTVDEEDNV